VLGQSTSNDSSSVERSFARPLAGELLLVGPSGAPDAVLDLFVHVAGGSSKAFVVIAETRKPDLVARLEKRGVRGTAIIVASWRAGWRSDAALIALLHADAVWVEPLPEKAFTDATLGALLSNTLARGGIVASEGASAATIVAADSKRSGLGLLPRSRLRFDSSGSGQDKDEAATTDLQWRIPARTALLVHGGRRLASPEAPSSAVLSLTWASVRGACEFGETRCCGGAVASDTTEPASRRGSGTTSALGGSRGADSGEVEPFCARAQQATLALEIARDAPGELLGQLGDVESGVRRGGMDARREELAWRDAGPVEYERVDVQVEAECAAKARLEDHWTEHKALRRDRRPRHEATQMFGSLHLAAGHEHLRVQRAAVAVGEPHRGGVCGEHAS